MSNNKMKNILRGLRYISQIFENDKEPEMQIGPPTDVKHVAHIGPGPTVNSPSWMTEFQSPGSPSAPLGVNGDLNDDGSVKWVSQDSSSRRGTRAPDSPARDVPELPKSSRRHSAVSAAESPTREKSDKAKTCRRSSKNASKDLPDGNRISRNNKDPSLGSESPSKLPDIPKKSRRKKSKESSGGGSSSRSSKTQASDVDGGSESGSISKSINNKQCHTSAFSSFYDGEENGYAVIS